MVPNAGGDFELRMRPWDITCGSFHFGDEHPFATYFHVHQGHRVLTHSHAAPEVRITSANKTKDRPHTHTPNVYDL